MECYVNYEIAKKLKEKGFSLNKEDIEFIGCRFIFSDECTIKRISIIGAYEKGYFGENIDCPTISQVLNWLRKEKMIYIEIFLYDRIYSYHIKSITQMCEDDLFHKCLNDDTTEEEYTTYEQAALAGIKYSLDNLI